MMPYKISPVVKNKNTKESLSRGRERKREYLKKHYVI